MSIFVLTFVAWIVGGHVPMTSGKSVAASTISMTDVIKRTDNMAKKKTLAEVKAAFKKVWGDRFDYSLISVENYVDAKTKVHVICPVHGDVLIAPHEHIWNKWGCPLCGREHQGGGIHAKGRSLVCGVGVNDSTTSTRRSQKREPSYALWKSILTRCYGVVHTKRASYANCSVCDEWLLFSNFRKWFDDPTNGYKKGYHIDKDILVKGNRVYSPDTCCFVPPEINTLIVKHDATRGDLPIGVAKVSDGHKYRAILRVRGKYITLGRFDTPEQAFAAYKEAKEKHIQKMATQYFNEGKISEKVYNALMNYKVEITD